MDGYRVSTEWVDVDDAHQVPHLFIYDIGYTELFRYYEINGCSYACPRGWNDSDLLRGKQVTSHSHYITHLPYTIYTMVATRLLSRNLARQSIALRKPVSIFTNQKTHLNLCKSIQNR